MNTKRTLLKTVAAAALATLAMGSAIAQHNFCFKVEVTLDINDEICNGSGCT